MGEHPRQKKFGRQSERGQLALEYVLILMVCVALAALLSTTLVSRNPDDPGFVIARWQSLLVAIGQDTVDKPN